MDRSWYRFKIRKITPDLKHDHHMEMVEEAWKLFNWEHNEKMKKQKRLTDY